MTRPLIPRRPAPWRPRPWSPLLALAVLMVSVVSSAGVGLSVRSASRHTVAVGAVSHSVQIVNFAFAPQVITIASGDSITWTNQDEAPHTVTTTSGPRSISSPMLSKGQSFTYTFTASGTYSYYCAVHPDMRAQVVVNPAPAAPSTTSASSAKPSLTAAPPRPTSPSSSAGVVAARPSAPATSHSDHEAMPTTGSTTVPSTSSPASSAPPPSVSSAPSATSADAAAAPAAPAGGQPLDPALVLAGLTAGATVFCLLLVSSRKN